MGSSSAPFLHPRAWAKRMFGTAALGDRRRTRRLVQIATAMMRRPNDSLPAQMQGPAPLKAAYRLLGEADVTGEAVSTPHWQHSRQAASRHPRVLLIQDTTTVDYTAHRSTTGLGPIGDGRGQGYLLHSVLAVVPAPRQVLGLVYHEPWIRPPEALGTSRERSWKRQQRQRESEVWARAVRAVGRPAVGSQWIHVGDRASDVFDFLEACQEQGADFLVRANQERRVTTPEETASYLLTLARTLPAQGEKTLSLPSREGKPAREAHLTIGFSGVTVRPPAHPRGKRRAPVAAWVVRVWEPQPPDEEEPIEWILITSVATLTLPAAWERVEWYTCRWLVEEYHKCLKTGCVLEKRQLRQSAALIRLLGILAPMAARLLQLREIARLAPERLATEALPEELVQVVALLAERPPERLTVDQFWREIARQGGHLGRRRDGPPGWQTLWKGWLYVQSLLEGVHLASRLPPT